MNDRLNRPRAAVTGKSQPRALDSRDSDGLPRLPAGLRLLDEAQSNVGLSEILAAIAAKPAGPDMRLREVEDSIRRHWAVLRNLVREHAELTQARIAEIETEHQPLMERPLPKVAMFTPAPRNVVAAE